MAKVIYVGKELYHHGILGMHWGIRRYQNPDGTLTPLGRKRLDKKDIKWAKKKYSKIYKETYKKSRQELNDFIENDLNKRMSIYNESGSLSLAYANEFNSKLAEIMTKNSSEFSAPSGRSVKFVAKRGEYGVHMILSDQDYDTSELGKGVYGNGKIAYKKQNVNIA